LKASCLINERDDSGMREAARKNVGAICNRQLDFCECLCIAGASGSSKSLTAILAAPALLRSTIIRSCSLRDLNSDPAVPRCAET
jgi:hypothetical protein